MTQQFRPDIQRAGDELTAVAGSYLHTVRAGSWQACLTCSLPVDGYDYCPQCEDHLRSRLPLADRTGYLIYADKGSQAYRTMFGYKGSDRLGTQFAPTVRGLLAVGLGGHFGCAAALAGTADADSGWAVVPSTRGRTVLTGLVRGISRRPDLEVMVNFTGSAPLRHLSTDSWAITPSASLPPHIVVIDDSWVSGSSAQSFAAALKHAGAAQVSILAVARVLSPDWAPNRRFIEDVLPALPYDWTVCPWTGGPCPPTFDKM